MNDLQMRQAEDRIHRVKQPVEVIFIDPADFEAFEMKIVTARQDDKVYIDTETIEEKKHV